MTWAVFVDDPEVDVNAVQLALGRWLLGPVELHDIARTDWVSEFRKHFRPFTVGSFRIVPEWVIEPRGERTLVMDPGRAFGTGTHESTRLCLLALEGLSAGGRSLGRLVDIGTGTGILSLAALQLGATSVLGTDNDLEALRNAAAHARINGRSAVLVCGDAAAPLRPGSFDGAVANIAAPLLQSRAEQIEDVVRPGGFLLLSGLLTEEVESVAAAYGRSADRGHLSEGEWSCVILERLP